MRTDSSRPLTELAKCAIPLAKFLGKWCYDLFCYHKVIKELESVASTLKGVYAEIQDTVNAAKAQGHVVNEGRAVPVWLWEVGTLIKQLDELKRDSRVESDSDGKLFLMVCLCTRCCGCGEAQKKIKEAIDQIEKANKFDMRLVGQAKSGVVLVRIPASHSLAIIEDQLAISSLYLGVIL